MRSLFPQTGPDFTPCPAPFNMAQHVLRYGANLPNKCALAVVGDTSETWTYCALERAVLGTASGLRALGLTPGARLLLRLGNTPDFPIAYLGAIAAGMIPVPTSAQLTPGEITKLAADLAPDLTIAAPDISTPSGAALLPLSTLQTFYENPPAPYHLGDPNRPAYIIFTSGTSGQPRGVVHAHRAIWARQMMHDGWYALGPSDRLLHAGGFNWTYTLGTGLMDPWSLGATSLIPAPGTAPEDLAPLLAAQNVTIFAAAPGIYRKLLKNPLPPLPNLRHGLSAGEKLPDVTRAAWSKATGTAIHEAFGMSECSTFLSGSPSNPAAPGTLGRPQPGRCVALRDNGETAALGTPGVIAVHKDDPGLMLEYLNAPDETQARHDGDWFLTGDIGVMQEDGSTTYAGRDDDMMNAGGFRVSPIEVEAVLNTHPQIHECAAVALPIKPGVDVIAVFYSATGVIDLDELKRFAAQRLAHYKTPRLYLAIPDLPRSANGKILRRQLRDTYESSHDQT